MHEFTKRSIWDHVASCQNIYFNVRKGLMQNVINMGMGEASWNSFPQLSCSHWLFGFLRWCLIWCHACYAWMCKEVDLGPCGILLEHTFQCLKKWVPHNVYKMGDVRGILEKLSFSCTQKLLDFIWWCVTWHYVCYGWLCHHAFMRRCWFRTMVSCH